MKPVSREILIQQLESVQPGLSSRDVVEQSSCFVFRGGRVITFNDEIACSQECPIGIEGAVQAAPMLAILRKLVEEEVTLETTENELLIHGKRKDVGIAREAKVLLPVESVEVPKEWKKLDEAFLEAIELVQHCASSDDSQFALTCVHITPKRIEACDNTQLSRVLVPTPVAGPILVRRDSIKHITSLGMTELAETETWIHFRNPAGLVLSCRRFTEDFVDLDSVINFEGVPITLPKGLGEAADKASIFVEAAGVEGQVRVELRAGKLRLKGRGASGWYREVKKLAYDGPELAFMISPKLLIDITKRYNDAQITEGKLKVTMGKATYVSCLSPVEE